jgi:hypothetical protein
MIAAVILEIEFQNGGYAATKNCVYVFKDVDMICCIWY